MGRFITQDSETLAIIDLLERVADTDATILISGESGTGKDLLARGVHDSSSRSSGPWVTMNCGAVPAGLQESELFGHERGAFTGADRRRAGRFEAADGGTVFLDEISEMPKSQQVGLLRILQSGEYSPVGSSVSKTCDVRVVSASNRDLFGLVQSGEFRQDLYYRLNIIAVEVPPLRDRRGDIPVLAQHFLEIYARRYEREVSMTTSFVEALVAREFVGNVRELENVIRRAVLVSRESSLSPGDLPCGPDSVQRGLELDSAASPEAIGLEAGVESEVEIEELPSRFHDAKARVIEKFERRFLADALHRCGGIVSRAAETSGLSERNFHAKLRQYDISSKRFREPSVRRSLM